MCHNRELGKITLNVNLTRCVESGQERDTLIEYLAEIRSQVERRVPFILGALPAAATEAFAINIGESVNY